MKHVLLAGACLAAVAVFGPRPAAAQGIPVYDNASIVARGLQHVETIARWKSQLDGMAQQYRQMRATYETLSHPNRVRDIARGMLDQQMRSPGSTPANIPGVAFGSQVADGAHRFLDQNRHAPVEGDDFAAQELRRREQATANIQAEAQVGMERAEERIALLDELQQSIEAQPDVTALAAVESRLSSERLFLANEGNNIARLQLMQATAARVDQQRAEQNDRQEALDWYQRARAAAGFGGE